MKGSRMIRVAMLVVLTMVALSGVAMAQEGGDVEPPITEGAVPSPVEFLRFLASPVGALLIGAALSPLLEKWGWFQEQDDGTKKAMSFGVTALVAGVCYAAVTYMPADVWQDLSPYWLVVVYSALAIFGNQSWFAAVIKRARADDAMAFAASDPERTWVYEDDEGGMIEVAAFGDGDLPFTAMTDREGHTYRLTGENHVDRPDVVNQP